MGHGEFANPGHWTSVWVTKVGLEGSGVLMLLSQDTMIDNTTTAIDIFVNFMTRLLMFNSFPTSRAKFDRSGVAVNQKHVNTGSSRR